MSNKIASSQQQPPTPTSIGSAASTPPPASAGTSGASHSGLITGLQKDEIINAIIGSNLELLKRLVTPELVNIKDRSGNTLLHLATNNQRTAIAKWLVSQGADVNAHCNGHTVLATALNHANYELFDFFLAHKAECIGRNQLNLMHEAVQQQRADIVNTLIGRGADPNLYNSAHLTPLSIACMNRNLEISLILMENGACANLPDKKGNTALHVACGSLDAGLIECLLANTECDLRLKNVQDETPLDQLFLGYLRDTRRPSEELVRRLVRAGALFSMPWNFALTSANAPCLILFLAILCKLEAPSLSSLFLNDKPFFTDLIVRGYWPNALLVALRASIIEPHFKTGQVELRDLMASIELIAQTQHFHLRGSDLLSTLYVCEEAANDPSTPTTDYQLFRHVRELYTKGMPLALKILCRNTIRTHMARANPIDSAAASSGAASSDDYELEAMQRVERLVYSLDATAELEPHTIKSLVQFLTLADYDLK